MPADHLSVATGSVGLIYQLVQAFCDPGDEVVFAWRSFEAYPIAVTAAAATSVQVPVLADGRHDLDAMAAAITDRTKVVLVCTPNNPTGPAVTQAELDAFLAQVPSHVLVVVDEAYLEFVRMDDAVDGIATYRRHDNVVLTRTFSKAYGLAGFRVGYAVAPAPIAAALRAVSLPFGVSTIAQAAAIASLERRGRAARAGRGAGRRARPRRRRAARGRLGRARGAGQLRLVRARRADRRVRGRRRRGRHRRTPVRRRGRPGLHRRARGQRPAGLGGARRSRADRSARPVRRRLRSTSISRQRGSTAGSMVTSEVGRADDQQRGGEADPGDQQAAEQAAERASARSTSRWSASVTRPISGSGIRSKITAPRIGLRKPEAKPPTTQTAEHRATAGRRGRTPRSAARRRPGTRPGRSGSAGAGRPRRRRRPSRAPRRRRRSRTPARRSPRCRSSSSAHTGTRTAAYASVEQVGQRDHDRDAEQHPVAAQEGPALAQLARRTASVSSASSLRDLAQATRGGPGQDRGGERRS